MTKTLLFVLLTGLTGFGLAQDTLLSHTGYEGFQQVYLIQNQDTVMHTYYPSGSIESIRNQSSSKPVIDVRYHSNGKIMWKQERSNNKANGKMEIYGNKGALLVTLEFKDDAIVRTEIHKKKKRFIFGQYTYHSTVYGGVQNPDGSSNISEYSGPGSLNEFYLVKQDSSRVLQQKFAEFHTDQNGFFFCEVKKGDYGIFPSYFAIEKVKATMGSANAEENYSMQGTWSQETVIDLKTTKYLYLPLFFRSVAYAP